MKNFQTKFYHFVYNWIKTQITGLFLETRERHADNQPPQPYRLKIGQIEFFVPEDAQCSDTYVKTIFRLSLIFLFNFFSSFWDKFFKQKI